MMGHAPLETTAPYTQPSEPLALRTLRAIVKEHYKAAGIRDPRKTTHSLRHTMVTNLIRHKVPPTKIMQDHDRDPAQEPRYSDSLRPPGGAGR